VPPACKKADEPKARAATQAAPAAPEGATAASAPADDHGGESGIVWVENDYAKALALAKAESKPLVIDMWADWCHTCLAMKKSVLSDRGLAAVSGDFIWLAVDTENPASAEAMSKFPPKVWPTFFVVSPDDESVQATQLGSCSVSDFRNFLSRGAGGHLAGLEAGGRLPEGSALAHLRNGDRQWLSADYAGAAKSYASALAAADPEWSHRAPTLKNQIAAMAKLDDKAACARLGAEKLDEIASHRSSASTDFVYYTGSCAEGLGEDEASKLRLRLLVTLDAILADETAALSYDDRSDALGNSRAIAEALKDSARALEYAKKQQALLAKAVKESQSASEEMTYVWHQVEVHNFLGEGEAILPWVASLEARLPQEYDPPYRKAWLLAKMNRNEEAHAALQVALPLVQGARRGRLLGLDADVYKAEKNTAKERETREAVLSHYEALPEGLRSQSKIEAAKKALAEMGES
jgi:thiol-disulfide isomerase/thioredoxin